MDERACFVSKFNGHVLFINIDNSSDLIARFTLRSSGYLIRDTTTRPSFQSQKIDQLALRSDNYISFQPIGVLGINPRFIKTDAIGTLPARRFQQIGILIGTDRERIKISAIGRVKNLFVSPPYPSVIL